MANPNPYSTNRFVRKQAQLEDNLAGLQLRKDAFAEQQSANDAREAASQDRINLDRQKLEYDATKDATEKALKFKAREQSIRYQQALARVDERDPDFQYRVGALNSHFPYASYDPELQKMLEAKSKAHDAVRASVAKVEQDTGVNPWDPRFNKRDSSGNWLSTDWNSHSQTVAGLRATAATTAASQFPLGGAVKVESQPGVTVTANLPSSAQTVLDNPSAVTPGQAALLINKGNPAQTAQEVAVGAAQVAATKTASQLTREKLGPLKAQLDAIATAKDVMASPEQKAKLALLQKQLDELIPAEETPVAKPAVSPTTQSLIDALKK